jgi:hypothetical protein
MIEEFYYFACNFCDVKSKTIADFKSHVNSVHFPGNGSVPENVSREPDVIVKPRKKENINNDENNRKPGEQIKTKFFHISLRKELTK